MTDLESTYAQYASTRTSNPPAFEVKDSIQPDDTENNDASSGVSVSYDATPDPDAVMGEPKDASNGVSVIKDNASKNDAYTGARVSDRDASPATVTPSAPPTPPATSPSSTPTTPPASSTFSSKDARRQPDSDLDGTPVYGSDACARQLAVAHPPTTTRPGDAPSASVVFSLPSAAGSRPPGLLTPKMSWQYPRPPPRRPKPPRRSLRSRR